MKKILLTTFLFLGFMFCAAEVFCAEINSPERPAQVVRVLIASDIETILSSQIAGKILELNAALGSSFEQGYVLVRFDCSELISRLKMSEADLDSAEIIYKSKMELKKLSSAGDTEVMIAEAAAKKALAQVEIQKVFTDYCTIKAPFSGRVVKMLIKPYQSITQGQPLLEIVKKGSIKVKSNIPSRWLSWMRADMGFRVTIDETGKTYDAVVTSINGRVDSISQTIEIEGQIKGDHPDLLFGMSGTASFVRKGIHKENP